MPVTRRFGEGWLPRRLLMIKAHKRRIIQCATSAQSIASSLKELQHPPYPPNR
jgi:hypothetical protein